MTINIHFPIGINTLILSCAAAWKHGYLDQYGPLTSPLMEVRAYCLL